MTDAARAIILFGHGSRDPAWRTPIEAVASRITARQPGRPVRCAYLELEQPDLATAMGELVGAGVRQVTIIPMFLGVGRHVRKDLPAMTQRLREKFPSVDIQLRPSIGEDPRTLDLLATIALE